MTGSKQIIWRWLSQIHPVLSPTMISSKKCIADILRAFKHVAEAESDRPMHFCIGGEFLIPKVSVKTGLEVAPHAGNVPHF